MDVNDVMHRKRAQRILGILKKVSELSSWFGRRRLTFASSPKPGQWPRGGCHTCWGGGRWKSQNRKNVYLSPYVEEPLNSKVIKSFVPEIRSRVFRASGCLCSMYICYEHSIYVSHIHVWVCYSISLLLIFNGGTSVGNRNFF